MELAMGVEYKIDDQVNYHSMKGQPATSFNHKITAIELMPNNFGEDVVWLTGKSGCVSSSHLSPFISLAAGGELNEATFEDFVSRLRYDTVGERCKEHVTADAMFIVEKKTHVSGIDLDYAEDVGVYVDDCFYESVQSFIEELESESLETLERWLAKNHDESVSDFLNESSFHHQ